MEEFFFSASEARRVKPLPTLVAPCDRCGLKNHCHTPKMKVDGSGRRKILIVGEYPGPDEDRDGRPMVGPTGRFFEQELGEVGIDMRRDCWITNAQICYDQHKKNPKTVIQDCRPHLLKTIRETQPEKIILLGGSAIVSLIGHLWRADIGKVKNWYGQRIPAQKLNAWVFPTYQPAYLQRQKDDRVLWSEFRRHLQTVVDTIGRPWPDGPPDYESRVEVLLDPDEAARRLRRIQSGLIAFDYETNTLKPDSSESRIVCASVCLNGKETFAYPWTGEAITETKHLLEYPGIGKIGYNMKFEIRFTRAKLGVPVRGWAWDGMLAAHCLDPRGGVTSLKFQAFARLGQPEFNGHIEPYLEGGKEQGGNTPNKIKDISLPLLLKYCAMDSLLEYKVAMHQMEEMGLSAKDCWM